ncbi:MAG: acyl-CoA/acyl-ACP dehydrogenase [Deltaproteobacteria bacterium]|nr:acyl-CoA/acyl-ACP dehydrogenase [Deltaproteobacteria bacterium]
MDFGFTIEQEVLRGSFVEFLSKECSPEQVRAQWNDPIGYSKTVWKKMINLGWIGLNYDEKYGGSEGGFMDLFILFEEVGNVLLPSPFFASAVLSGMLINEYADQQFKKKYLPAIISGKKILTTALMDEHGVYDYNSPNITATVADNGTYHISGTRLMVPYAQVADDIIVCTALAGKNNTRTLFKVDRRNDGIICTPLDTIYGEKKYAVEFVNVKVKHEDIIGAIGEGHVYIEGVLPKAILLKCAEMSGGARHVVDSTVAYVKVRKQFGRPLGTLQAVQHQCADMIKN